MNKGELTRINKEDFNSFFKVMEKSFPEIERRTREDQKSLFGEKRYKVFGYKDKNNEVTAFIACWEFDEFYFIEHFAVDENIRGNGIGSRIIEKFIKKSAKKIVLEVELPQDEISKRRINFYKRIGMNLNDYDYVQPPLQEGNELLPLKIMSYPENLDKYEFNHIKNELYRRAYNYSE